MQNKIKILANENEALSFYCIQILNLTMQHLRSKRFYDCSSICKNGLVCIHCTTLEQGSNNIVLSGSGIIDTVLYYKLNSNKARNGYFISQHPW